MSGCNPSYLLFFHSKGEIVRVNFGPGAGQPPFKYDIEALVSDERAAQAVLVER